MQGCCSICNRICTKLHHFKSQDICDECIKEISLMNDGIKIKKSFNADNLIVIMKLWSIILISLWGWSLTDTSPVFSLIVWGAVLISICVSVIYIRNNSEDKL